MTWNFDMAAAPRGETRIVTRIIGKTEVERQEHVPALIIAAGADMVVTVSKWLPDQGRWNMFAKDHPPKAWQPWPKHFDADKLGDGYVVPMQILTA